MSPAQPKTMSGSSPSGTLDAHSQTEAPEREVLDGRVHVELLELRLLVYCDEVDIVTASVTVARAGEEGVGVGGR
jgi:hypothetical protein